MDSCVGAAVSRVLLAVATGVVVAVGLPTATVLTWRWRATSGLPPATLGAKITLISMAVGAAVLAGLAVLLDVAGSVSSAISG